MNYKLPLDSVTVAINSLAQEKAAAGIKVFNLSAGEPKLPSDELIVKAVTNALATQKVLYPPVAGFPELKQLAATWMNNNYYCHYDAANCLVVQGGKLGIYLLLQHLLTVGDEVIMGAPLWVSYPTQVELFGGVPNIISTNEEQGWKITAENLKQTCNSKSKILILNNGTNPTGALYTRQELADILQVAHEHGLWVISDEVYSGLTYDAETYVSCGAFPEYQDKVVVIQSCSKNFAMTGWRIGFVFAAETLIKPMTALVSQSTSGVAVVSQWAAMAAFKQANAITARVRTQMQHNRDRMLAAFKQYFNLTIKPPASALYVFIALRDLGITSTSTSVEFCKQALEQANVALVPGTAFAKESYVRLSFGAEEQDIDAGIKALANFCRQYECLPNGQKR